MCPSDMLITVVVSGIIGGLLSLVVVYVSFMWGYNTAMREEYPDLPLEETKE